MAYYPQTQQPYPQNYYPQQPVYPSNVDMGGGSGYNYPQNPQQYPPSQPQIIYRDCPHNHCYNNSGNNPLNDPNKCWLISLLTLCCGCLIGEACCDSNVCCCLIPCALPRFR